MLTVNVLINVMIIGQPPITAIFRWRARLAYESTVTVMDLISGTTLLTRVELSSLSFSGNILNREVFSYSIQITSNT